MQMQAAQAVPRSHSLPPFVQNVMAPPRYTICGEGGQATCYTSSHQPEVVIKMFKGNADQDKAMQREINALKGLANCEGVIQLLGRSLPADSHSPHKVHWEAVEVDGAASRARPDQLAWGYLQGGGTVDFTYQACLLLEKAPGGPLWHLQNTVGGPLSFLSPVEIDHVKYNAVLQLARAVSAVHGRGYTHMDLHPAQVHIKTVGIESS
jgi:hypothetical protein